MDEDEDNDQEIDKLIVQSEKQDGFITIAKLTKGSAFGELALLENKPRMADIRCLKNCHFMILSKENYNRIIGAKEKRLF